jgi:hypothetical protein
MAETTNNPGSGEHGHGHRHDGDPSVNPEVSFERRDVDVFQVSAFGIGLLIACIVVVFGMYGMFAYLFKVEDRKNEGAATRGMLGERAKLPPEPRLQGFRDAEGYKAPPKIELKDMREDEDAILNGYGWVDPNKGTVRIPIDMAIDMVAKKGLPSKPSPAGMENDGYRTIPEDSSSGRTLEKIAQ